MCDGRGRRQEPFFKPHNLPLPDDRRLPDGQGALEGGQGGLGVAAGGNINPDGTSMFEPMGGSAPKYTGQNVINPLAAINAAGMMLDFLGEEQAGTAIENAAIHIINTKIQSLNAGQMGYGTREVGDLVAAAL